MNKLKTNSVQYAMKIFTLRFKVLLNKINEILMKYYNQEILIKNRKILNIFKKENYKDNKFFTF